MVPRAGVLQPGRFGADGPPVGDASGEALAVDGPWVRLPMKAFTGFPEGGKDLRMTPRPPPRQVFEGGPLQGRVGGSVDGAGDSLGGGRPEGNRAAGKGEKKKEEPPERAKGGTPTGHLHWTLG